MDTSDVNILRGILSYLKVPLRFRSGKVEVPLSNRSAIGEHPWYIGGILVEDRWI